MSYNQQGGGYHGGWAPASFDSPFEPSQQQPQSFKSPRERGNQQNQWRGNTSRGGGGYRGNYQHNQRQRGGNSWNNSSRGGWVSRGGGGGFGNRNNEHRGGWNKQEVDGYSNVSRGGRGNFRGGHRGGRQQPSAEINAKEYIMPQMWGNPWAKLEAEYAKEYLSED